MNDGFDLTHRQFLQGDTDVIALNEIAGSNSMLRLHQVAHGLKSSNPFIEFKSGEEGERTYVVTYDNDRIIAIVKRNLSSIEGVTVEQSTTNELALVICVKGKEEDLENFDRIYMQTRTRELEKQVLGNPEPETEGQETDVD